MNLFLVAMIIAVLLALTVLMCIQESRKRRISLVAALLICILTTPLFGYLILSAVKLRHPRGCKWCGNYENEAEYCGLCGKNEAGERRS